jgi:hypothetical protein
MENYLTKDNRKFMIRRPGVEDAEKIINYSKILFASGRLCGYDSNVYRNEIVLQKPETGVE